MMETTCQKCPKIKGDTYCGLFKKQIWKNDEMCRHGYLARMMRCINMCSKIYDTEPDPDKREARIEDVLSQGYELEKIYQEKFPYVKTEPKVEHIGIVCGNPEFEKEVIDEHNSRHERSNIPF